MVFSPSPQTIIAFVINTDPLFTYMYVIVKCGNERNVLCLFRWIGLLFIRYKHGENLKLQRQL